MRPSAPENKEERLVLEKRETKKERKKGCELL